MMRFEGLLLIHLLASVAVAGWEHTGEQDFRRAVSGHNHALVAFIEPSSAKSQALEPEWTSVAKTDASRLLSVDCAAEAALCGEFGVISYPALRFFDGHGNMSPYRGPRKASAIRSFLKRAVRPTVSRFTPENEAKLSAFQKSDDDVVFVATLSPEDEHIRVLFQRLASEYRDRATFGLVEGDPKSSSSISTTTTTSSSSNIKCHDNKDQQRLELTNLDLAADVDALPKFVESCLRPLVGEFTRATETRYLQSGKSLVFYFAASGAEREAFVDAVRPVAKMYREYLHFVTVDAVEYGDLATPLGLVPGELPALAVQNPMFGQVFPYPRVEKGDITPETVGAFVMDIVQGKVQPWDGRTRTSTGASGQTHDEL